MTMSDRAPRIRDRNPKGRYMCDQNLHISGGDCPHCVPCPDPPIPPAPPVDDLERLLRRLVAAVDNDFAGDMRPLWADARALLEELDRG
jgi:hypothetical protein